MTEEILSSWSKNDVSIQYPPTVVFAQNVKVEAAHSSPFFSIGIDKKVSTIKKYSTKINASSKLVPKSIIYNMKIVQLILT